MLVLGADRARPADRRRRAAARARRARRSPVAAATLIASNGACRGSPRDPSPTTKRDVVDPEHGDRPLRARGQLARGARSSTRGRRAAPAAPRGSPSRCRCRARGRSAAAPAARASAPPRAAARSSDRRRSAARRSRTRGARSASRHEPVARDRRDRREHALVADRGRAAGRPAPRLGSSRGFWPVGRTQLCSRSDAGWTAT